MNVRTKAAGGEVHDGYGHLVVDIRSNVQANRIDIDRTFERPPAGHGHGHVHMSVDTPKQPTANVQTTIRLVQTSLHLSGQARSEVDEVEVYDCIRYSDGGRTL